VLEFYRTLTNKFREKGFILDHPERLQISGPLYKQEAFERELKRAESFLKAAELDLKRVEKFSQKANIGRIKNFIQEAQAQVASAKEIYETVQKVWRDGARCDSKDAFEATIEHDLNRVKIAVLKTEIASLEVNREITPSAQKDSKIFELSEQIKRIETSSATPVQPMPTTEQTEEPADLSLKNSL